MIPGTSDAMVAKIAANAATQYAKHELRVEGPGRWYCGKPDTGMGSFRVVTAPNHILVFGDMPEIILAVWGGRASSDPLPWLRGAVTNTDYLLGKAVRPWGQTEFYRGDAIAQLRAYEEEEEEWPGLAKKVREDLGLKTYGLSREFTGEQWLRALYDAGHDEPPDCCWYSPDMLRAAASLRKFVELEAALPMNGDSSDVRPSPPAWNPS